MENFNLASKNPQPNHCVEILLINDGSIDKLEFKNSRLTLTSNHIIITTDNDNYSISNVYKLNKIKSYKTFKK
jgi:hypothetical protein